MKKYYTDVGFGFDIEVSDERLRDFLKKREEKLDDEIRDYIHSHPEGSFEDDDYREDMYYQIANIMSVETGLDFYFLAATDGPDNGTIMFLCRDSSEDPTENKLYKVCKKYMEELDIESEPTYFQLVG